MSPAFNDIYLIYVGLVSIAQEHVPIIEHISQHSTTEEVGQICYNLAC